MRQALGVLGWTPETFWNATPKELLRALEGWQECYGLPADQRPPGPLSVEEIDELRDLMEQAED